jgi:hypothetical protein
LGIFFGSSVRRPAPRLCSTEKLSAAKSHNFVVFNQIFVRQTVSNVSIIILVRRQKKAAKNQIDHTEVY